MGLMLAGAVVLFVVTWLLSTYDTCPPVSPGPCLPLDIALAAELAGLVLVLAAIVFVTRIVVNRGVRLWH